MLLGLRIGLCLRGLGLSWRVMVLCLLLVVLRVLLVVWRRMPWLRWMLLAVRR